MSDDPGQPGGAADDPLTGMFQRIFSDPDFATALERDPAQALRDSGFDLDEQAIDELNRIRAEEPNTETVAIWPAVAVAVRVYTSPAIRAGTNPAVRVATRTQVSRPQQQEFAERLKQADQETAQRLKQAEKETGEEGES